MEEREDITGSTTDLQLAKYKITTAATYITETVLSNIDADTSTQQQILNMLRCILSMVVDFTEEIEQNLKK